MRAKRVSPRKQRRDGSHPTPSTRSSATEPATLSQLRSHRHRQTGGAPPPTTSFSRRMTTAAPTEPPTTSSDGIFSNSPTSRISIPMLSDRLAVEPSLLPSGTAFSPQKPPPSLQEEPQQPGRTTRFLFQHAHEDMLDRPMDQRAEFSECDDYLNDFTHSFFVPTITVGPSTFALMTLRSPTPSTQALSFIGGGRFETTSPVTSSLIRSNFATDGILTRTLYQYQRPLSRGKRDHPDIIQPPECYDLLYSVDKEYGFQSRVEPVRSPSRIPRQQPFTTPTTGKIFATYVTHQPHVKATYHFWNCGSIDIDGPASLKSSRSRLTTSQSRNYLNLFTPYAKTHNDAEMTFITNAASALFTVDRADAIVRRAQSSVVKYMQETPETSQQRVATQFTPDVLAPFPSSHVGWHRLVLSNAKAHKMLAEQTSSQDSTGMAVHTAISHDTLDPALNAWLLPLRYHWQRPHAPHPAMNGQQYPTHPTRPTQVPLRNQSLSLHWVPLSEMMDLDDLLSVPTSHRPMHGTTSEEDRVAKITQRYAGVRPDLVAAYTRYAQYYQQLPAGEGMRANNVFSASPSRLVTTSTGLVYPIERPVVDALRTTSLRGFLDAYRQQERQRTLDRLGVTLKQWNAKLKHPLIAREFGSSFDEIIQRFAPETAALLPTEQADKM